LQFGPIDVSMLQMGYAVVGALFSLAMEYVAEKFGRAPVCMFALCLSSLCFAVLWKVAYLPALVSAMFFHGGLTHGTWPLGRALISHYTESTTDIWLLPRFRCWRLRWKMGDWLASCAFSAAAIWGARVADERNYRDIFEITSCIYAVVSVMYLPIIFLAQEEPGNSISLLVNDERLSYDSSTWSSASDSIASYY